MPMVQIVASDGTRHFNNQEERKSIDKQLLTHYLSLSRRQLSEKEVAQVKKAHEEAKTLLEAGDEASAIEKLKPAVAMRGLGDEAAQVDALVAELIEKARSSMNEAHQQLQSETDAVRGAVELLRVHRIYGEVPELKAEILELAAKVRSEKSLKKPFNLARMIDRADKLPRKTASQRERAIKTYQSIARNHEKNQAGEIATERIAALGAIAERPEATEPEAGEPDEPATASQDGKTPVKPAVAKKAEKTQEQKDAELYFRIARTSARTDRQKAREYAEKVIELVPDSKLAESARKLLEQL
jgi:hypothetical protein